MNDSIIEKLKAQLISKINTGPTEHDVLVDRRLKNIEMEIRQIRQSVSVLNKMISTIEKHRESCDNDIRQIRDKYRQLNERIIEHERVYHLPQTDQTMEDRNEKRDSYPRYKFARYADSCRPVGFSEPFLQDIPAGCCYRIEIRSSDEATFRFVEDENIKQTAVQAMSTIIDPCCSYDLDMPISSKFKTIKEGKLKKSDNIWQVEQKSVILFLI